MSSIIYIAINEITKALLQVTQGESDFQLRPGVSQDEFYNMELSVLVVSPSLEGKDVLTSTGLNFEHLYFKAEFCFVWWIKKHDVV